MMIDKNNKADDDIPVIDLKSNNTCRTNDDIEIGNQLIQAFRTIGFATLINHGIEESIIQDAYRASLEFFTNLTLEQKLRSKYVSHESNRGYIPMGSEQFPDSSTMAERKETFDIGSEIYDTEKYQTPWPTNDILSDNIFRNKLMQYFHAFDQLYLRVMKLIAIGLQLPDEHFFVNRCNEQHCNLRLLHYPEIKVSDLTTTRQDDNNSARIIHRGAEHRDYGTITLLSQDLVGGLRVQKLDGTYIFVDPTPNSIIVNVGDMLQRWTNDLLIATPHQVINHPSHGSRIIPERYSIAFFCNPNRNVVLEPLIGLLQEEESTSLSDEKPTAKYEPITAIDYLTQRLAATISV